MHNWSSGYGIRNPKPTDDSARRLQAVTELAQTHHVFKVLDFGCGHGSMLRAFSDSFDIYGFEPETLAYDYCRENGFKVFSDIEKLSQTDEKFDLISMFHVIEHVYEPGLLISKLKDFLRPQGLLVIETPNSMDALLTLFECKSFQNYTYWSHHPMLYSSTALAHLVTRSGFKVVKNSFIQRYSLDNHLYWLSKGKPGGHEVWREFFGANSNAEYAKSLISKKISDTLWIVAMCP